MLLDHETGNFFRTIEFFNKVCGVWVEKDKGVRKLVYILWDAFLLLLALFFFLCEVAMMRYTIGDLKQLIRHIGMLGTHTTGFLKFAVLIFNHGRIAEIKVKLQDKQYHYKQCGNFSPAKIFSKSKNVCHRYTIVTYLLYNMVGVSAHISALWHLNSDQKGKYFTANATCYDFMPYFFIIPFSTETISGCKNAFIMMDAGLGLMALYIASYDALLCSLLICLKTKLHILCEATKNIRERVVVKLGLPEKYCLFKDDMNPEFEAEMYAEIRRINFHLESLISVCNEVEAIFSCTTLIQTITSLVVLASCLFVASLVPYTDPEFYSRIEYSLAILCQLLMICYFGNLITDLSLFYRYSLYDCDWYSSSQRFKQAILIMMCRTEKPLYLTIGKFSPLTLNTFVSVVKGSFSYAAVFRTVD